MRKIIILIFTSIVAFSCDSLNESCPSCYPGAPEVGVEFNVNEATDSVYMEITKWSILDDQENVKIRYEDDTVWNTSSPFMSLTLTDTSVLLYGTGVIWNNLEDLNADLSINFGNNQTDTISIEIGVNQSKCCESNYIEQVLHNGEELTRSDSWFYQTTF